ncbi:MAG: pyrimidine 5'-nucleotidase [Rhodobacteraceae bacterium]|nr:MAG: pyrimidine 5'-nucleotidase [Paracoccaceae bacterium]
MSPAPHGDPRLRAVETWVFDLDNTLYPPALRLFDQVNERMTAYVMRALGVDRAEAEVLRARYWREHGTTLAGLMARHALDPDPFLEDVHAIDLSHVAPDAALAAAIARLRGRKIVYTNGSRAYGRRVAAALGLSFDAIYGVEDAGYTPKPRREAFERVFAADGLDPGRAAMVEDDQRNLVEPAAMGMVAIWRPADPAEAPDPHVRHVVHDLTGFLAAVA